MLGSTFRVILSLLYLHLRGGTISAQSLYSVLSYVRTDAITHNIVVPTMSWIVAIVLAVLCKRMQQLSTMMRRASLHRGKNTTHKTCCLPGDHVLMPLYGPNNVRRAVQTYPTLLRYDSSITGQKKCWELLTLKFDCIQTLRNNSQQHTTKCNSLCKRTQHLTSNYVASVCWGLD